MDQRFPVDSDPRFIRPKKRGRVVLDSRFSSILDPEFSEQPLFDKYGRRLKDRRKDLKDVKSLYILPEKNGSDLDDFEVKNKSLEKKDLDGDKTHEKGPEKPYTSSEEDDISSEEDLSSDFSLKDVEDVELADPEPENEIPRGEMTSRLAVVNLDWDHIRSVDIFAALGSFVPKGGSILSVKIYPSEFGRKRMEKEDIQGPPRSIFCRSPSRDSLVKNKAQELGEFHKEIENSVDDSDADDSDDADDADSSSDEKIQKEIVKEDNGNDFNMTQLRKYQLERLRYYYAIVTCDSIDTAKHIYIHCDGREYEASANFFDLRFVPDNESFDSMQIRDECSSLPEGYTPEEFVTDALKHSNVKLMWDNDDPVYLQMVKRAFSGKEIDENDFKVYLASTDSDASDAETTKKYRSLLLNNDDPLNDQIDQNNILGDMKVTFMPGIDDQISDHVPPETSLEKYKRKEKERKKRNKDKHNSTLENSLLDSNLNKNIDLGFNDPFFSLDSSSTQTKHKTQLKHKNKIIQNYTKKTKQPPQHLQQNNTPDPFQLDLDDPRFSAMYSSHHFDIDPTNPRFKKTHSIIKIMQKRQSIQNSSSQKKIH
ncbi:hypothetical protein T552_03013 [Pneumocystis carinii B80]|uniref:Uncharacterized protein n=1 Tax=Pneumocystis carinii (strain B80) TaxID=1408658 RepID=A0A0W4ZCQ9_PNEC8|nr:hypothetical protein T552_03013 [Pneumocystis carinii B80]KTW26119.1 hypothetical protein T552_03013 [Pneumocystis carinii B80]